MFSTTIFGKVYFKYIILYFLLFSFILNLNEIMYLSCTIDYNTISTYKKKLTQN